MMLHPLYTEHSK
jgi:Ran GTPase-activating protein (RanGAP) involved in mRNA processing and transport